MNTVSPSNGSGPRQPRLPRWAGALFCGVGIPVVHGVVPWAISLLGVRHGWVNHHPAAWNFAGLVLVVVGAAGIVWALVPHFVEAPRGWEFERAPKYLLTRGPYQYSRNPIYVCYSLIWPGWMLFYGSIDLVLSCVFIWPVAYFIVVPREERNLHDRFGETYRDYQRRVPRWLGKIRH